MSSNLDTRSHSTTGEPTWEVAALLPNQGQWSESDFFQLHTNRMAELAAGHLEVLPMPTWLHQLIVKFLVRVIEAHIEANALGGVVLFAPLPVRLFAGTIREPDVLYVAPANLPDKSSEYPERVDLVMEVVSEGPDARRRDYEHKRTDYARAHVSEYWIVDPEAGQITVLALSGSEYETAGVHRSGEIAVSRYMPGLTVTVSEVLALANQDPNPIRDNPC